MRPHRTISLVSLWQVAASLCYYAVFAAAPFFRDEFELTGVAVGLVVTFLTLGYAAFLLPIGAVTDRYGERRTLTVGLAGLAAGAFLVTETWSYPSLLAAVFLLGTLYGTAMPGTNKAIFDSVPPDRQNLAVGVKQVGVTAGSGLSAVLVTKIADVASWEAGFRAVSAVAIAVAAAFAVAYRGSAGDEKAEFPDFRELLRNRPYRSLCAAGWFLGASLFTSVGYAVIYLEQAVGTTVAVGGLVLAALQVSGSGGRIVSGWLSDALPGNPRRRIGSILLGQTTAGAALFAVVGVVDGSLAAIAAFVTLGFFVLGFTGVYYSCMATLVPREKMGGATAGGQLALTTGGLVVPPAFGYVTDYLGYRAGWLALAGLTLFPTVFIVRVIRTPSPDESRRDGASARSD